LPISRPRSIQTQHPWYIQTSDYRKTREMANRWGVLSVPKGRSVIVPVALGEDRKGPAGMKKRQDKVSEETAEYTER
jgi:hypothetical protein